MEKTTISCIFIRIRRECVLNPVVAPIQTRYEIGRRIGAGGAGVVYEAHDTKLDRQVAFKRLLPPEESEDKQLIGSDLLKEARALSSFQHPHIVSIYDVGEDGEGFYIVMQLLEGETVEQLARRKSITPSLFVSIAEQVLEGMVAAHARNFLHRDLKPSNLLVTFNTVGPRRTMILDFGLAKLSSVPELQTVDQTNSVLGSIYFMAPEQFLRKPLDARCDLYQLGCVFAFALTRKYPFDGEGTQEIVNAHLEHTPRDIGALRPDVPGRLMSWVTSLMERHPEDRPESAAIALHQLRSIAADCHIPAAAPGAAPERPAARPRPKTTASSRKSPGIIVPSRAKRPILPPPVSPRIVRSRIAALETQQSGRIWILVVGLTLGFFLSILAYAIVTRV